MQTPALSNSRKRRRSDQCPFELEDEACQTVSKKRKAAHTPDPEFLARSNGEYSG